MRISLFHVSIQITRMSLTHKKITRKSTRTRTQTPEHRYDPERDGPMLSQIRSLRKLSLTHNNLTALNSTMRELVDLLDINLRNNNLSWFPKEELSSQIYLLELDLSYNHIRNLPRGMLTQLPALRVLFLTHNRIDHVESYAVAHTVSPLHGTLTMLNIANQDLTGQRYIRLEDYAFAGCCEDDHTDRPHNSPLILSINRIPLIPAYAFVGLNRVYVWKITKIFQKRNGQNLNGFVISVAAHTITCNILRNNANTT